MLDLEFALGNASGLVPMYLSLQGTSILEAHLRDTLALSPAAAAVALAQAGDFADSGARSDGFRVGYVAQDFEVHG